MASWTLDGAWGGWPHSPRRRAISSSMYKANIVCGRGRPGTCRSAGLAWRRIGRRFVGWGGPHGVARSSTSLRIESASCCPRRCPRGDFRAFWDRRARTERRICRIFRGCRRQDSNLRHADYDRGPVFRLHPVPPGFPRWDAVSATSGSGCVRLCPAGPVTTLLPPRDSKSPVRQGSPRPRGGGHTRCLLAGVGGMLAERLVHDMCSGIVGGNGVPTLPRRGGCRGRESLGGGR
jgi:hypothetical protein